MGATCRKNTLLTPINEQPIAPSQCHAPSHCRPDTCTTLRKEKPKEMLNVSERSLVNVYCFSLFFGENVEQAKEMPMDLTICSHDTRRERIAYHIVVAAMLIPLVFGFLSQDLVVPPQSRTVELENVSMTVSCITFFKSLPSSEVVDIELGVAAPRIPGKKHWAQPGATKSLHCNPRWTERKPRDRPGIRTTAGSFSGEDDDVS